MFLDAVFGKKAGEISKQYIVFILENEFTTISIYKVKSLQDTNTFIEIEAQNEERMLELENNLNIVLKRNLFTTERIDKSLFEIFIK